MANRWRRYSYAEQKSYFRRLRVILTWLFVFFLVYSLVSGLFVSNRVLNNRTMEPGLAEGDRFLFTSFALIRLAGKGGLPVKRGQIVLVDRGAGEKRGVIKVALDAVVRFCTLQRVSVFERDDTLFIKRVIGLPGDTVSIENFVVRVKPAGDSYEYTEFELAETNYIPNVPQVSLYWDESLPFSGTMEPKILGGGEFFVLSDDRSVTNDSRSWGPVSSHQIIGSALLRYWPLTQASIL
ncbi:MAG: signal peptidase I [Treponema sp.]|jgi:signal peptidase I|nr:signal peptidase I [Treponema sp.]